MFSRNCELFEEVSALCTRCTDLKNNKPSDMSRRSILNSNDLAYVFGPHHGELKTMNECRNQSVKCVIQLHDPLAGGNEEESARWFLRLWETLLTREKDSFRKYVGNTVLNLSTPMDFCVHVEEKSTAAASKENLAFQPLFRCGRRPRSSCSSGQRLACEASPLPCSLSSISFSR